MAPLTAQGSQKRIESRCCQSPNSPISSKTFVRLRGSKFIVVMSDVWCWSPDHKHSVALLLPHQAPHSLSTRGEMCHKPLHWGTGKIKWDWWRIFCQFLRNKNFSCELIYIVRHYILSKKTLEGTRPWNRAPISHARHSTGQHPKWCVSVCSPSPRLLLEYPLSHKTAVKSVITHQLVAGDGRYAHPLWQEHVFWKFLTDIDQ